LRNDRCHVCYSFFANGTVSCGNRLLDGAHDSIRLFDSLLLEGERLGSETAALAGCAEEDCHGRGSIGGIEGAPCCENFNIGNSTTAQQSLKLRWQTTDQPIQLKI